jgi:Glycosyltransferase WbsX
VVGTIFSTPRDGVAYLAKELKWALDNQPDLIFLSSWNDWAFGNTIEPSDEYGFQCLDLIHEMLTISSSTRLIH